MKALVLAILFFFCVACPAPDLEDPSSGADRDGDGVVDVEECDVVRDICAGPDLCPVCSPGTSRACVGSAACAAVVEPANCSADAANILPGPEIAAERLHLDSTVLQIFEEPVACEGGYVWKLVVAWYGITVPPNVRLAWDGSIRYDGPIGEISNIIFSDGSEPAPRAPTRLVATNVCVALDPGDDHIYGIQIGAQLVDAEGRASMRVCGRIRQDIPE